MHQDGVFVFLQSVPGKRPFHDAIQHEKCAKQRAIYQQSFFS